MLRQNPIEIISSSSDRRGRKSREEGVELIKKERSKTSGRQLGQKEDCGYVPNTRRKTLGRDRDQARKAPVRNPAEWKRPDRSERYQVYWFSQFMFSAVSSSQCTEGGATRPK